MKLLVISYLFPNCMYPESGIFVLNRIKAMSKYCDVRVINPIPWFPGCSKFERYKNFQMIPEKEKIAGINVYHPRFFIIPKYCKYFDSISFCFAILKNMKKYMNNYRFDLIDLHWTYPDILSGFVLSKLYKKKFFVTIRGKEALNFFTGNNGTYYKEKSLRSIILNTLLPKANKVISLSRELQHICIKEGVLKKNTIFVQNGVDTAVFRILNQKDCRRRLGLPEKKRVMLSVGSINMGKGHDRLIRAFKKLKNTYPDLILYIIGTPGPAGDYSTELYSLVAQLNLENKIHFVGQVANQDLPYWYNAADVFCLASRGEGSPNVLTEALACGCPSVATDVGAVKDVLSENFLGCVVANNDIDVVEGIETILSGNYNRKKIAAYMLKYNWTWCANKLQLAYHEAIKDTQA